MNHSYAYLGCFFTACDFQNKVRSIRRNPLERDIQAPHVTFAYRPQKVDESLFGKNIHITVIGYGNDGENEGVKVRLYASDPVLQSMIEKIEVPHITIAVSSTGKPVNTRYLEFEEIEPFDLVGNYGGYTLQGNVVV